MADSSVPEGPGLGSGYAAALESLRSTAKWLLTAFAGIAAALTAGLQLTGIGALPPTSWRLWAALAGLGTALATLGYMASSASAVLTQDWVTLNTFTDRDIESQLTDVPGHERRRRFDRVAERIEDNRHELYGHAAPDLPGLHRRLREADEKIHTAADPASREAAVRRAAELRSAAREVVQCANYYATLDLYRRMKTRLTWAALVAAVAIGVFAYASSPPKPQDPVDVRIHLAAPAGRCPPPPARCGSEGLGLTRGQHVHDHDAAFGVVLLDLVFVHLPEDDEVTDGQQHGAESVGRHAHPRDREVMVPTEGNSERIGQFLTLGSPHLAQELFGRTGQPYLLLHTSPYERPIV
ncbi:hypothetical protein [Streptomyces poonensis]|uniref:SMODS and SLOG-associating 2TM effector domain-containing protein n=1 Tax=Streptomyces poonensis TaxID=68255 RepID=A0A918UR59_9ACTN|nr:hypothetical protein [Streptomyces poonensis]GGZ27710.1 hypothetical protein GCM10010365_54970 [Streptomyces poonensis]GLJ89727.1 hypothetical protein GCM10017589_23280 [Streptomyces poonensis]